ncbi:MAG: hypothetical protein ACYDBB_16110 [Armatimonadota bacterium]
MKAGFARVCITPPLGSTVIGLFGDGGEHGAEEIHDDLFVRALYLTHGDEEVLIVGVDLLFFSRAEADRYTAAIGRKLGLAPRQIMLNTSHTHTGPSIGQWGHTVYTRLPDPLYLEAVEKGLVEAALNAKADACEVTLQAGVAHTTLPRNRRRLNAEGIAEWLPDPEGTIYNRVPICLFSDTAGKPVSLLFSVSCHLSTIRVPIISADYPGVAVARLNEYLGIEGSLFLQGVGGETKPIMVGLGDTWISGTWDDVAAGGKLVADDVIDVLKTGLQPVEPDLRACQIETSWPLQAMPHSREELEALRDDATSSDLRRRWAERTLLRMERGQLPTEIPILMHGVQLAEGLRLVSMEGEAVAEWGYFIEDFFGSGVTFPMGYTDGCQVYLTTSHMADEHGYEVDSYYEYGWPAPLATGMEETVAAGLKQLRQDGIR